MADANVELVLQALRNFEREDFDTVSVTWHEDGVISGPPDWPEPGPFRGQEAVRGQLERLASDFQEHEFRDVEVVGQSGEWLVIRLLWNVSGAGSGMTMATRLAAAYRIVDGRIKEAHFRWTEDEVTAIAGIEAQPDDQM